jgi:hypothetical protein
MSCCKKQFISEAIEGQTDSLKKGLSIIFL